MSHYQRKQALHRVLLPILFLGMLVICLVNSLVPMSSSDVLFVLAFVSALQVVAVLVAVKLFEPSWYYEELIATIADAPPYK